MNELLDDDIRDHDVIARLRSALDELTASAGDDSGSVRPTGTMTPARWLAAAAAAVLVVGAVTAVVVNRGNQGESAATPTTGAPITLPPTTEPTLIRVETPFFTLASPDLVPGERTFEACCAADRLLTMVWSSGEISPSYLTLTEYPAGPLADVFPDEGSTVREVAASILMIRSFGLTDAERDELSVQLVAGSGLPYVLPVDGWSVAAMGFTSGEDRLVQVYTPLNTDPLSSYLPTVTLSVGEYRGEFDSLALSSDATQVVVAGYGGWKFTEADGTAVVFWDVGNGNWATLRIDAQLADRTDGLIAALSEIDPSQPVVEVEGGSDPVGETVPAPLERRYQGVASVIDTGNGPMIAFSFMDSLPPQGGDIPLVGFDWDMIDGEQSVNGTTWSEGSVLFTGTFDGTSFRLTEPATSGEGIEWPIGPTYDTVTPDCTDDDIAPDMEILSNLDDAGLHIISSGDYRWDGHCGVQVYAAFDTPELQAALAPLGDQVTLTIAFVDVID